jgi:hypothetical protein
MRKATFMGAPRWRRHDPMKARPRRSSGQPVRLPLPRPIRPGVRHHPPAPTSQQGILPCRVLAPRVARPSPSATRVPKRAARTARSRVGRRRPKARRARREAYKASPCPPLSPFAGQGNRAPYARPAAANHTTARTPGIPEPLRPTARIPERQRFPGDFRPTTQLCQPLRPTARQPGPLRPTAPHPRAPVVP